MNNYAKGIFELDLNVINLEQYEEERKEFLESVVKWAENMGIDVLFGTSNDNAYLCEFKIKAKTKKLCDGYVSELKSMLKNVFPKPKLLYQEKGTYIYGG